MTTLDLDRPSDASVLDVEAPCHPDPAPGYWPIDEQTAHKLLAAPVVKTRAQAGDFVLVVPYKKYRSQPRPGDTLMIELRSGEEVICDLVRCTEDRELVNMFTGKSMAVGGNGWEIVGLGIGFQLRLP